MPSLRAGCQGCGLLRLLSKGTSTRELGCAALGDNREVPFESEASRAARALPLASPADGRFEAAAPLGGVLGLPAGRFGVPTFRYGHSAIKVASGS